MYEIVAKVDIKSIDGVDADGTTNGNKLCLGLAESEGDDIRVWVESPAGTTIMAAVRVSSCDLDDALSAVAS